MKNLIELDADNYMYKGIQISYIRLKKKYKCTLRYYASYDTLYECTSFIDNDILKNQYLNSCMNQHELDIYVNEYKISSKEYFVKVDDEWKYIISTEIPNEKMYYAIAYETNFIYYIKSNQDNLFMAQYYFEIPEDSIKNIVWSRIS